LSPNVITNFAPPYTLSLSGTLSYTFLEQKWRKHASIYAEVYGKTIQLYRELLFLIFCATFVPTEDVLQTPTVHVQIARSEVKKSTLHNIRHQITQQQWK